MTDEASNPAPGWRPPAKTPLTIVIIAVLVLVGLVLIAQALRLWPFAAGAEQTDDAAVKGETTVIAPQVSGYVTRVLVHDYQTVRAGDPLVAIDDATYRTRVAQADSAEATQAANLANADQAHRSRLAALAGQSAALASARAQLERARADMARVDDLVRDGSVSQREADQTRATLRQAEAQVRQAEAAQAIAREDVRTVDVGRHGLSAAVGSAHAVADLARIDLGHTLIRAPESGQLSEVTVRNGQFVTNGTQLLFLVPARYWIIANFKETQTRAMHPGQRAHVTVDALGGRALSGHVEALAPAAGSEFAVLKPDNATGNYVKVAQRIGVRITIDPGQPLAARLRPGMSVVARVDTGDSR